MSKEDRAHHKKAAGHHEHAAHQHKEALHTMREEPLRKAHITLLLPT